MLVHRNIAHLYAFRYKYNVMLWSGCFVRVTDAHTMSITS